MVYDLPMPEVNTVEGANGYHGISECRQLADVCVNLHHGGAKLIQIGQWGNSCKPCFMGNSAG